jgi:histone-lysine N-methyltransferase SETMAR
VRPHTSLKTWEAITEFGRTVLPHPPYSPDLSPSDFHLFGARKDAIRGTKFETDDDVICALRTCGLEQGKALVSHWHKAVDVDGDFEGKKGMESNHHPS